MAPVQKLSKGAILRFALQKRAAGEFYDTRVPQLEEGFRGSIDRLCDIALAFLQSRSALDVGSGSGLLLALLAMLGHDVRQHYLYARPVVYKGREYYPERHNREFTRAELALLLGEAGFREIDVRFLKSRRYRTGFGRIRSVGTALKDAIAPLRKSLIAFARK